MKVKQSHTLLLIFIIGLSFAAVCSSIAQTDTKSSDDSIAQTNKKTSDDSIAQTNKKSSDDSIDYNPQKIHNLAFGVGERLVFDVSYGIITAGEAILSIPEIDEIRGRKTLKVVFEVNSLPFFSWIYKVRDQYQTYLDIEGIYPWRFEQHIREGSYKRDFTAEFDHRQLKAFTSEGDYPIPRYVHDILSAFYFARTINYDSMRVGFKIPLQNFYKDKTYPLDVKYLGRQQIKVDAGTFKTIIVEPLIKEGGLFKSDGRIVLWITDDDQKIPVKVSTKVPIGTIDVELREYSGLQGPIKAKIE